MSKRSGDFISAQDLLNEVDKDQIRFMMLNRSNDVELDFDFDKVKEKTKDNPVFYVQYAYARINSILRTVDIQLMEKILLNKEKFELNEIEEKIIRKIFEWPKIIESASKNLIYIKFLFIYTKSQPYFILIGAKEMKIKSISLLKMIRLKDKKF